MYVKTSEWHSVIKHCTEAAGDVASTLIIATSTTLITSTTSTTTHGNISTGFGEQHSSKEAVARSHCAVGKAHVQLEEFEDAVRAYQRGKDAKVSMSAPS